MTTDHTSQLDQIYREVINDLGGNLTAAQEDYINHLLDTLALIVGEMNSDISKLSYSLRLRLNDQSLLPKPKDADV